MVTADDGLFSFVENALPELPRYRRPCRSRLELNPGERASIEVIRA
jgi:hypothetical protein